MKKLLPLVTILLSAYVLHINLQNQEIQKTIETKTVDVATPTPTPDQRLPELVEYLESKGSPMAENAPAFIEAAEAEGIDYKLLVAIAGNESSFGKNTPSCADYNAFGRISTTSPCGFYRFNSFDHAIRFMAEEIGHSKTYNRYQRSRRIVDLAKTYCPGTADDWAAKITYFMEEI